MTKNAKLTVAKTCMTANFYDAACDYPKESFEQITCRMLGSYGFPRTKNTAVYKRECRKAFKMGRRKKWETNRWWAKNGVLKCCKCGTRTRKFTAVCENCGHRFCKLCRGGK